MFVSLIWVLAFNGGSVEETSFKLRDIILAASIAISVLSLIYTVVVQRRNVKNQTNTRKLETIEALQKLVNLQHKVVSKALNLRVIYAHKVEIDGIESSEEDVIHLSELIEFGLERVDSTTDDLKVISKEKSYTDSDYINMKSEALVEQTLVEKELVHLEQRELNLTPDSIYNRAFES